MTRSLCRRLAVAATILLTSCGSDCAPTSCFPPGTYIAANDGLGAVSAEICFDDDCTTVGTNSGADDTFTGFDVGTGQEGQSFDLRLTVFDAAGGVIDTLTEHREMDSSACACGVLAYDWKDGRLHRVN